MQTGFATMYRNQRDTGMRLYKNGLTGMMVLLAIALLANTAYAERSTLLNDGDYPALYKKYDLPEYPTATMTYDGRKADNLADGISLKLTTPDAVQAVGAFYQSAFNSLEGWTFTPPRFSNDTLYGATATHDGEGLRYHLVVTRLPDHTQISISFLKP